MALDPMSNDMTMKNVAGFHSPVKNPLALLNTPLPDPLKGFGTIDAHKEGDAIRGREDSEELYHRENGGGYRARPRGKRDLVHILHPISFAGAMLFDSSSESQHRPEVRYFVKIINEHLCWREWPTFFARVPRP